MTIRELQKKLADALNGVEELVQGGCKAFAEDTRTVYEESQQWISGGKVAIVVVTPDMTRNGCNGEGVARGTSRMIALKTSPVWAALSAFGNPYPPFDFGSGMGLDDVEASVCRELGLGDAAKEQKPTDVVFNGDIDCGVPYKGRGDKTWLSLCEEFGDQISHDNGKIVWRGSLVRDAFRSGKPFEIHLGKATKKLRSLMPPEALSMVKDKSFTVKSKWLDKPRKDGTTHRQHFAPLESDARNIPLTDGDLDLIPTLWRSPDRVIPGDFPGSIICELDTFDGGVVRMIVGVKKTPVLHTLYKKIPAWDW